MKNTLEQYIKPSFEIVQIKYEHGFAESAAPNKNSTKIDDKEKDIPDKEIEGCSPETAIQLTHIPFYQSLFEELDPDIKVSLKRNGGNDAVNYRKLSFSMGFNIEYLLAITTNKSRIIEGKRVYIVFGTLLMNAQFLILINIDQVLTHFLNQIREKNLFSDENEKNSFTITNEIKQKMPTFTTLVENAEKIDQNAQYGLPFITFWDVKKQHPLLAVGFGYDVFDNINKQNKIKQSLLDIGDQLIRESRKVGTLEQTKQDRRNLYRVIRLSLMILSGN